MERGGESREKQKAKWFEKYNLENKKYDLFTVAKQAAHKGYMSILNKTNCSTLSELQEFTRLNGGDYLKQAQAFLTERSNARSGQIKSESMSFFYGRMFVDESSSISEIQYQKIIAQSIFEC